MELKKDEIDSLREKFRPVLEEGRKRFGKETYDNHIIDVLEYFGYSVEDEIIIEIFFNLERK